MRSTNAFTLVELLLALAICAMVGAAAVMMLVAMSNATKTQHDIRRATVRRQVIYSRISPLMRDARLVLNHGDSHLVLWIGDTNNNAKPELSELRRLVWDDNDAVWVFAARENLGVSSDVTYTISDDFNTITDALAGSADFPGTQILRHVVGFEILLDHVDAAFARAIQLRITTIDNEISDTSVVVAALRAANQGD